MITDERNIAKKFNQISPYLNEKILRIWAAIEALSIPRGGITLVAKATGIARSTIHIGISELEHSHEKEESVINQSGRIRRTGGGRKKIVENNSDLKKDLELLVDSSTRGDPETPLKWTSKSTYNLAKELNAMGYRVSQRTVYTLLDDMEYSMQSNRKTKEGSDNPDRDAQFRYISEKVKQFQLRNQPVISVDTKKKELIGKFKNNGQEWQKKGNPIKTNVHDFPDKELGKVAPYGIYDLTQNKGWVSVGISHDTAEFAVSSIRSWWKEMGQEVYPDAKELLITADGGGSNGSRVGLWKKELRKLSDELGLEINVCHFPPGTSKWNKIEHKMFCHITKNWRGRPLVSRETVVNLIGNTTTKTGLSIKAKLDTKQYEKGIKVTKIELENLGVIKDDFHGEWNYKISPRIP
jgi:Rhodopirellula transposase DDE domain